MLHFPASPRESASGAAGLNATQRNASADPMFAIVHDELHDARRVRSHGQEDDLRAALDMVIKRVETMSIQLSGALKSQADLEVQLNMAKSNLQLVIANNEMLEEALKISPGNQELGWKRSSSSVRSTSQPQNRGHKDSIESVSSSHTDESVHQDQQQPTGSTGFFRSFRFGNGTASAGNSRPGTPYSPPTQTKGHHVLSSPSMPSLSTQSESTPPSTSPASHQTTFDSKKIESELESLRAKLIASQTAHTAALQDKTSLEEELESLSQALFEEANKMVKVERIKRAEMEDELKEVREEREALKSALRVVAQKESDDGKDDFRADERTLRRSSSRIGVKSPPPPDEEETEADMTLMSPSTASLSSEKEVERALVSSSSDSPSSTFTTPPAAFSSPPPPPPLEEPSPWADVPSSPKREPTSTFSSAGLYAIP